MRKLLPILLLLTAACGDRTPPEPEPQNIRPARVMTVALQGEDNLNEFPARIEALQTVDLSFEVGGPLARLPVKEGEAITEGTVIAALDPKTFELALQEAEVQLRLAAQDLNRKRKVLAENGIAKSIVEDALSNYELQRVRLAKARESLSDATIRAPFDAYVARRYFDQFVNIRPGESVVRLLDLTRLQVVFNVPERLAATGNPAEIQRAWVEFPFAPDESFEMTYYENRGEAAAVAQTYEVSFLMNNPAAWNILPGMTATARIRTRSDGNGQLLVPASALVPAADSSLTVWVYDDATQTVARRQVVTSAPQKSGVPVTSGLEPGEQIVVTGASQLQAGMKIRPL